MLFDAIYLRVQLKFHMQLAMSDLSVSGFHHFDFRLKADRIVHSAMLLLAAVTSASYKQAQQR